MKLTSLIRQHLPTPMQDAARTLLDLSAPSRRKRLVESKRSAADGQAAAQKISPDGRVLAGPFAGMWMPFEASWGGMTARLAGGYEEELVSELQRLIADEPPVVVDVGAAEGYYAVGLALALPASTIYAFDIDRRARQLCRLAAQRNNVHNIRVRGRIDPRRLQRLLVPGSLVLSDCEGYELELLDPETVPKLLQSTLLVELHEFVTLGLTRRILARFADTHQVAIIDAQPRSLDGRLHLAHLTNKEAEAAVDEGRPTEPHVMQWAVFRPERP